ncbi:hypothetical protein [Pseudalkalibacillus sp. SCS-8]|uniref:hypothetical protein n=1 Tax=Pseudalkalibacillus nanhaiensis TaxID=3115291 RepID=UPI0032DB0DE1
MNQLDIKDKPFLVNTVSEQTGAIRVHNGLIIQPDFFFENAPEFDVIVVPGGPFRAIKQVQSNKSIMKRKSWLFQSELGLYSLLKLVF